MDDVTGSHFCHSFLRGRCAALLSPVIFRERGDLDADFKTKRASAPADSNSTVYINSKENLWHYKNCAVGGKRLFLKKSQQRNQRVVRTSSPLLNPKQLQELRLSPTHTALAKPPHTFCLKFNARPPTLVTAQGLKRGRPD